MGGLAGYLCLLVPLLGGHLVAEMPNTGEEKEPAINPPKTAATSIPPKVTLYPERPVELGEPNMLVCLADEFSPPVVKLTWLKNGQEVEAGMEETDFYPRTDNAFRKFSYLPFVPEAEDIYYCRVEHWGLAQPLTKEWNANMAEPLPETGENVVCGLGPSQVAF
ncbi:mamu class II histocompatibility antigen, DR alpha chain-like [Eublepharis macularius]|uniref:Mamu class II histocompatibility antigen, DR alpha chain-like n=1 Tax=Eublepharis macularius TaxID=481883 RepID=A0AA97J8D0_EUBMA|nr:mamu class II histocompatibility antigen, DR alpha chain-like [Eublepharis macularius]